MPCTVEQRCRHRAVAHELEPFPSVAAVTTIDPQTDPSGQWTTEIVVREGRVPPGVLTVLGAHELGVADVSQRGNPVHTVVIVR